MKRFLLFAGSQYYPCGGWDDLLGKYDSPEAAKIVLDVWMKENDHGYSWAHIVDIETGERMVEEK